MQRDDLTSFLNDYLQIEKFQDSSVNGLQVEGAANINKIVLSVSASVQLFSRAIEEKAEAIIVHHGIIWDYEHSVFTGSYRERVRLLLENNINLYAYHLPLDGHLEVGHGAQLAKLLNVENTEPFEDYKGRIVGIKGNVDAINIDNFIKKIEDIIKQKLTVFSFGPEIINSVGIVSGGGQKDIKQAVAKKLDAFITGEVGEPTMHYAKEEKINFISAGHYATEKFGIIALGNLILNKFGINTKFIDIPNPA